MRSEGRRIFALGLVGLRVLNWGTSSATGPKPEVLIGRDVDAVRENCRYADETVWEVLTGHVYEILEYSQRHAFGHVHYRASW
jgi:hypothetical protein